MKSKTHKLERRFKHKNHKNTWDISARATTKKVPSNTHTRAIDHRRKTTAHNDTAQPRHNDSVHPPKLFCYATKTPSQPSILSIPNQYNEMCSLNPCIAGTCIMHIMTQTSWLCRLLRIIFHHMPCLNCKR